MSDIPYRIIRSDRKTASIEVDRTLNVTVRAPLFMPEAEIDRFVKSSAAWIEKAKSKQISRAKNAPPEPDEQRTAELKQKAKEILLCNEINLLISLGDGEYSAEAWGCDLTYDYVKINGDYRT